MKISVIYGLFLIAVTLHLPCEAKELSNLDNSSSNNELKQLLAGKRYKRRLKSTRTAKPKKKLLDKPINPKKKGITTTQSKKRRVKNSPSRPKVDLSILNDLLFNGGLPKRRKSSKKPAKKKPTKNDTTEKNELNGKTDLSDGLNDLPKVKEPTPAEPPAPAPAAAPAAAPVKEENKPNGESTTDTSLDDWAIDGLNALLTDNSDSLGQRPGHSYPNPYQFIDKGQTVHNDAKTKSKNSSFLTIQDYDKTFDDTFNLEDALETPETTAKAPKGKQPDSDLMDLILTTPKKNPKSNSRDKKALKGPTNDNEDAEDLFKDDSDLFKDDEDLNPKPKKTSQRTDEANAIFNPGPLDDIKDKLKTATDGITGILNRTGAKDKLKDVFGLGGDEDKTEDEKENDVKKGSEADSSGDKDGKPVKSKSKIEDISPAHKTEYKEKLVDSTFDKDFKHLMGDGEFGTAINYYKGHEISGDRTKGINNIMFYNPRDPAEDWNNSGLAASLRYLGSGYDIIFGNPLGDPVVMMDQGYRNPVIKLDWDVEYLNSDGANLKEPHGSWVRPEFSCRQSETIDHVNTVEDFKKELSIDAQASYGIPYFFSFSGSTGYKNFVKSTATNKVRTYITKTYCLRYVAGIVNFNSMDTTEEFRKAVSDLPNYFDSQACTLELFKNNEDDPLCANSVRPWVKFIKMFGTHFTTIVHLGGKITHQVQINKSDVLDMQQHGVNVDLSVKAAISPTLLDNLNLGTKTESESARRSESEHFKYEKQVLVIGGDGLVDSKDINSLNCWTKDLYKKPMPIQIKLESIKSLLTNDKQRESFEEALKFYSETYGVSPDEIYKKYGRQFGIASLVQKGYQVVYSGNKSGSAVCPPKTVIIMGFTMTIMKKKNFIGKNEFVISITHCPVGEEKCLVSNDSQMSESRIWAVCGEDTIPLLNQQTSVKLDEPATASCPSGYSIAYGFAFSIPKGNKTSSTDSYPCRPGTLSCTHESTDKSATNAVWIACVENGAPQLTDISNHMVSTSSRHCSSKAKDSEYSDNVCPTNSKLIAGWSMDFSESDSHGFNQIEKCSKNTPGCKVDKKMATETHCRSHYSWISCLHETAKAQ
ncbi:hypothetical protein MACK_000188 [Theileria orientalis]|uniref:MACPF domain-containing protein n=1 Tax=Theileria orientalis TaxID=68886 RepID=A0A976QRX0_THEOR|nr:hypothetical protein MACK_000188 [Theileria orientalis]